MSTFEIWGLAMASFLAAWLLWFRHWHTGFGTVLRLRHDDGTVWVCSRLSDSPAGKEGINAREQLLDVDGHSMTFGSVKEFRTWMKANWPVRGKESRWTVEGHQGVRTVVMKPRFIMTSIPAYWSPNERPSLRRLLSMSDDGLERGLRRCRKTGELLTTYRLSDGAIAEVIR